MRMDMSAYDSTARTTPDVENPMTKSKSEFAAFPSLYLWERAGEGAKHEGARTAQLGPSTSGRGGGEGA